MSTAADNLRTLVGSVLPGWHVQFGRWNDEDRTNRYAVIRPAGGIPAQLVREPQFTITLIASVNDAADAAHVAADAVVEAMRSSSAGLVYLEAGEPVSDHTSDGRPKSEVAVSAITN